MISTTKTKKQLSGRCAEQAAALHLQQQGLNCVISNFRCCYGEIDLVMQDRDQLVFVEVRLRLNLSYGSAVETVTKNKQRKIKKTAAFFLQRHYPNRWPSCRFDVVGVHPKDNPRHRSAWQDQPPQDSWLFDWIPGAFY